MSARANGIFALNVPQDKRDALNAQLTQLGLQVVSFSDNVDEILRLETERSASVVLFWDRPELERQLQMLLASQEARSLRWVGLAGFERWQSFLGIGVDAMMPPLTPVNLVAAQLLAQARRQRERFSLHQQVHEAQLQASDLRQELLSRDQLSNMLVHDLKNPLSSVSLTLGELKHAVVSSEALQLIESCEESCAHMITMSMNLLQISKIQAGKLELERQLVTHSEVLKIIEQSCGDVGRIREERELVIGVPPHVPLFADPAILRRIFTNLISNAHKHTRSGGRIEILGQKTDTEVIYAVRDNGEGIPEADQPHVFSAFERIRTTMSGRFDTGIGLAFCRLAMSQHGGKIWVESTLHVGSTFYLSFPLQDEDELFDDEEDILFLDE